jgi:20S proteasome alpha/beta subunit
VTIAIGLLHQDGVVLATDSLVSSGTFGAYQSKVVGCRFPDGVALFALAGNVALAESAIEQCEEQLKRPPKRNRTCAEIAAEVRAVLAREYREHVSDANLINSAYDYALIVVVGSRVDGLELYSTSLTTLKRSRAGYECAGAGSEMAQSMIHPYFMKGLSGDCVRKLAIYALANVKRAMPGVVGGNLVVYTLWPSNGLSVMPKKHIELMERYSRALDEGAQALVMQFLDIQPNADQAFAQRSRKFCEEVIDLRESLKRERLSIWPEPPPIESFDVIREITGPRAKKRRRKAPTGGQSTQQPSQE